VSAALALSTNAFDQATSLIGSRPQFLHVGFGATDNAIIIERGCVVHSAESATLSADRAALEKHLGVNDTGPRRIGRARQPN
jgi:hypothetical protein